MIVDFLPSVIAFAESRIKQLNMPSPETEARIDELKMVISLCKGLQAQNALIEFGFQKHENSPAPARIG